ncbi:ribosome recycling factor [Chloroflexota bacterium]
MVNQILWNDIEAKMQKTVEGLRKELATIRTGHATPGLIEHIKIEYAGVPTPLNQVAGISAPEARLLVIQPWDKGSMHSIEKAILMSDLGLNPVNDGNVIRINIPLLSEERRQELMKVVRRRIEERRIAIRNLRHDFVGELKELEKNKDISQDEHRHALTQLQKLTDNFITNIEQIGRDKESELEQV